MKIDLNDKNTYLRLLPYILPIIGMVIIVFVYFSPALEGKVLEQHDVQQAQGMAKEIQDYQVKTGELSLWTNSMFCGMPTYQIWIYYPANLIRHFMPLLKLWLPSPMNMVFLYFLGFYILMLVIRINPWLAFIGGLAFAFSSSNFIIIVAGHVNKAVAIGLMPLVIAGVLLTFRKKYLLGLVFTAIALSLEILANHLQISYYLSIMIGILLLVELVYAIKEKGIADYAKAIGILLIAATLAIATNITSLWVTNEYAKYTMRGGSDLRQDQAGSKGLEKDYALGWSYGRLETFTLIIPGFSGGASTEPLGSSSNTYKAFIDKGVSRQEAKKYCEQMPTYWGPQKFTAGPTYFGALICFLFILGLFLVKGRLKWWVLMTTILSIMLSWGNNLEGFTDFFFYHFPLYNKFRAVSMILDMAMLVVPILGIICLNDIITGKISKNDVLKGLKRSLYIFGGLLLFFVLFGGSLFDFVAGSDDEMMKNNPWLVDALKLDRASMLRMDALRSLAFVLIIAGAIFAWMKNKIKLNILLAITGVAVLIDMWGVDRRYLNDNNFIKAKVKQQKYNTPKDVDLKIMEDKDPEYRVLNLTVSTFNDALTSYFHKSIGGYHGAKLARYQDMIDVHLYPEMNDLIKDLQKNGQINPEKIKVLSMLNTKYIIAGEGANAAILNPYCLGSVWFVKNIIMVDNPKAEIEKLKSIEPKYDVVVNRKFESYLSGKKPVYDSTATIKLTSYAPNDLKYSYTASSDQMAVFSEVYYDKGWQAYLDDKPVEHIQADYLLRAMEVPAGKHTVEFKFHPKSYYTGEKISLASSILLLILLLGSIAYYYRKNTIV